MHRSSRSVSKTVYQTRTFHFSPLCLNSIPPRHRSPETRGSSEGKDRSRPVSRSDFIERLWEVASLTFRGRTTKANSTRKCVDRLTAVAQVLLSGLPKQLNLLADFEKIEQLKKRMEEQDSRTDAAREAAQAAKIAYEEAVVNRVDSLREVNDLIQRRPRTPAVRKRLTELIFEEEPSSEEAEALAKEALRAAEKAVEREFKALHHSISERYRAEKHWSDKIRILSTIGSVAIIISTFIIEPWKKRQLTHAFEKKVEELPEETRKLLEKEIQTLESRLDTIMVAVASLPQSPSSPPPSTEIETVPLLPESKTLFHRLYQHWCGISYKLGSSLVAVVLVFSWFFDAGM